MTNLPISSPYRSKPEAPVTDIERDQLSTRLNAAFADGKLDQEGYEARLDQLFAAQKLGQLVPVVEGLPPLQTYNDPTGLSTGGRPGQLSEARSGSRMTMAVLAVLVAAVLLIVVLLVVLL